MVRSSNQTVAETDRQLRAVKRERSGRTRAGFDEPVQQDVVDRRILRSKYRAIHNKIKDEIDELTRVDSDKFTSIFKEVEDLHQLVQKPREQVADAEALLDITNTLVCSVKSQSNEGITPSDFVSCFLKQYGGSRSLEDEEGVAPICIKWKEFGLEVSPILRLCNGITTMMGPMNTELKQRKVPVQRKRTERPTLKSHPEEVDEAAEKKTDTDRNMSKMFKIFKDKKCVRLENLILNRKSFAQTVENLFALSFLVKDGRVEIKLDENRSHLVSGTNAPSADAIMSKEASYKHFVFRFDFKDWKLMKDVVPEGEELMPHRVSSDASQVDPEAYNTQESLPRTPIRKFSLNRGRVLQEDSVVEDSPEIDDGKATGFRRCKRKLG